MSNLIVFPAELNKRLMNGETCLVIDVRTPVEFSEVHAQTAVNIPLDRISGAELAAVGCSDCSRPVYLLCRSGQRATKAAEKLKADGFTQTVVIEGGTLAWIDAGLPVARGATKVISLERQVRIAAGAIVFSAVLLAHFVNPHFVWLAAFVGAGLVFAGITDFCGMGLLIARLPWNQRKS
ncbi:MAG TPA: rhodanese-like domain-containing protein [Rariglobus sp.]|jgi:rhodanese-related sulfurtransferase|nr:rhodanese-like domain-containing protein [Rariglobus sp.]